MAKKSADIDTLTPKRIGPKLSMITLVGVCVAAIGAIFFFSYQSGAAEDVNDDFVDVLTMVGGIIFAALVFGSLLALRKRDHGSLYKRMMEEAAEKPTTQEPEES